MIVHFIPAEKFVDRAISLFEEAFPGENRFYIFSYDKGDTNLRFVKSKGPNVRIISNGVKWWKQNLVEVTTNDTLFFHNLYSVANIYLINKYSNSKKHLALWGYEFYGETSFWSQHKYGNLTINLKNHNAKLYNLKNPSIFSYYPRRIINILFNKKERLLKPTLSSKIKAFKNVDFIQTHVIDDYDNVRKRFGKNYKWSNFSYYTYEDYKSNNEVIINENRIQVGNSATFSNNHLEVFTLLEKLQVKVKIFCPLNYGDKNYAKFIEEKGKATFGNNFQSLLDFLPLQDYNNLQASCGIVIMNHYRQQAAGNIISALLNGSKIFMSNKSPLLNHFKRLGLSIYTLEDDLKSKKDLKLLTEEEVKKNKDILKSYYSRQNIIEALKTSISI